MRKGFRDDRPFVPKSRERPWCLQSESQGVLNSLIHRRSSWAMPDDLPILHSVSNGTRCPGFAFMEGNMRGRLDAGLRKIIRQNRSSLGQYAGEETCWGQPRADFEYGSAFWVISARFPRSTLPLPQGATDELRDSIRRR